MYEVISKIRDLTCPRCGEKGKLQQKTTVSKRKYRYKKWYIYHEKFPKRKKGVYNGSFRKRQLRIQRWCYLNEDQLRDPIVERRIRLLTSRDVLWGYLRQCCETRSPVRTFWEVRREKRVDLPSKVKEKVYKKAHGRCQGCCRSLEMNRGEFHYLEEPNVNSQPSVLQFLCPTCHRTYAHEWKTDESIVRKKVKESPRA